MFSENFGDISFTRVTSFITIMTVLGTWVTKNIGADTFIDFGSESAYIILFVIGGKVASKWIEVAGQAKEKEIDAQKD